MEPNMENQRSIIEAMEKLPNYLEEVVSITSVSFGDCRKFCGELTKVNSWSDVCIITSSGPEYFPFLSTGSAIMSIEALIMVDGEFGRPCIYQNPFVEEGMWADFYGRKLRINGESPSSLDEYVAWVRKLSFGEISE